MRTRVESHFASHAGTRILPRLRPWGVAKLVAEYSGYGDDGCINSLGYFDTQGQPVNMDLVRPASDPEIQNLLYELLPDGFETGEGGQGDLARPSGGRRSASRYAAASTAPACRARAPRESRRGMGRRPAAPAWPFGDTQAVRRARASSPAYAS
jgi:hypothetical protein